MRLHTIDTHHGQKGNIGEQTYYTPYQATGPNRQQPQQSQPRSSLQSLQRYTPIAPVEGWLAFLLLAIALYSVVVSIISAKWVDHSMLLLATPLIGLSTGLIVAKLSHISQGILHLAACLLGYWFATWLTCSLAFHINWLRLLGVVRAAFVAGITTGPNSPSEIVFFFYLSFLCFFLGYFGSWLIYRAHLPWLVALVYCSIMLVNLNYTRIEYQNLAVLLILILAGALTLLIARVHLAAQVIQWKKEGLHTDPHWSRAITQRNMQIASALILVTLLLSSILPIQEQSASGKTFWNGIDNALANISNGHISLENPSSLFSPYQTPTNFFSDQLTISGSVHLPTGEVLIYTNSNGPQYLEGFSYNNFDGHTWTATATTVTGRDFDAATSLPLDTNRMDANQTQTMTQIAIEQPPEGPKHYLFAPAQPASFTLPVTIYTDGTTTAWTKPTTIEKGEHYQVTSLLPPSNAAALSGVPLAANDPQMWIEDPNYSVLFPAYLQIPHDLSPNVQQTATAWTQGAKDTYSALKLLESHLNNPQTFTYSVDNPPIPTNVDAVDWLLQTHRGYCTYYASAMAVMARYLGIPTRVMNGFSQGHYDAQRKVWSVLGSDAHSWVQAYFPAIGWVNFDPTPGYAPGAVVSAQPTPVSPTTTRPTPQPTQTVTTPQKRPSPPPTNGHTTTSPTTPGSGNALINQSLLMSISLGILLLSFLFLLFSLLNYWWRNLYANSSFVAGMYWRFCYVASWLGMAPQSWQTPYEYSSTLSQHCPQQTQQPLWHLTELFVRERWGSPTDPTRVHTEEYAQQLKPHVYKVLLGLITGRIARLRKR